MKTQSYFPDDMGAGCAEAIKETSPSEVQIIRRLEIPSIDSVVVEGVRHFLGDQRDFRRNQTLAKFIPENARLAIAWVRLKPGEVLSVHVHPIESMILICEGSAEFNGDFDDSISTGDAVIVPRGARHGFRGTGPTGFVGLSIQFENQGLYEDPKNALVKFEAPSKVMNLTALRSDEATIDGLVKQNEIYKERFHNNLLFRLMSSGHFKSETVRSTFLEYFQGWSNQFQKAMLLKTALCDDPRFKPVFRKHFVEELGHDQALARDRKTASTRWDAVLEATCSWFPSKMIAGDLYEQIVIMHLCVEAVAVVFYKFATPALDPDGKSSHFRAHEGVDVEHEKLGLEFLEGLSSAQYRRLLNVQAEAWSMSEALFGRLGQLMQMDA